MRYAPQILLCFTVWISVTSCVAREPLDPELLKKFTKEVETVLSPTLVVELQGAQSNRSAVNVQQTAPRNPEQSRSINDKKPEIHFDNQVYPYHYERSYHYQYPPNPQGDPSRPLGYSENFYEPRFRPKNYVADGHDPTYYRSELYNPYGPSSSYNSNSQLNSNAHTTSTTNDDTGNNGDVKQTNSRTNGVLNGPTSLTPSAFAHPEILTSPPQLNPFPSVDFSNYRHGVFARPPVNDNYFRPNGDAGQYNKDSSGHYLPQGGGSFPESFHQKPVESYQPLPPLDSSQIYPDKEFQGYSEHRSSLPEGSSHGSQHLARPFLGSFFPPGYQSPFHNSYRPSEHFNNLFSDNFTRNFPLRPSFGGFYPNPDYHSPSPSPSPSPFAVPTESRPENPVTPGSPSSQPIPTVKPDDPAQVAAASNSNYELKLFFPARDGIDHIVQPSNSKEFIYIRKNIKF